MENLKFYERVKTLTDLIIEKHYNPLIIGKKNIPNNNFIIISNHIDWKDPALLLYAIDNQIKFMTKKEAFENRLVKWFIENMGSFPIDRNNMDLAAIKYTVKLLKEGNTVGIFPEGTRSKNKELLPFKSGIPGIARLSKTDILPCGISGEYKKNGNLTLNIGKPINYKEFKKTEENEYLREQVKSLILSR